MKLTTIAAKLRMTAAEMEAVAALGEDMDWPVEVVPAFIVNWVTDPNMFSTLLRALATDKSLRSDKQTPPKLEPIRILNRKQSERHSERERNKNQ